jgi:preprotein translocase subunit YajC
MPAGGGMLMELPLIALVIAIFYFVVIRPQTKRTKDQKAMVEDLQKGDEVVTSGGQLGRITKITESHVVLEVSPEIGMLILKTAVQTLLPKGTLKTIEKETLKGTMKKKNKKSEAEKSITENKNNNSEDEKSITEKKTNNSETET